LVSVNVQTTAVGGFVSVPLLRWPAERAHAQHLERSGLPFLLLLGEHEPPPQSGYRFMDWVRSPVDPDELIARRSNLENRFIVSEDGLRPLLDCETGRLTFGTAVVDVSPSQVPLLRALADLYREVLPDRSVWSAMGLSEDDSHDTFASQLMRLRRRLHTAGLDVVRVRGVGYALEPARQI
jgi:hypothetical protein